MAVDPNAIYEALAGNLGRSPIYRWLLENQDAVAKALALCGSRPDWKGLAKLAHRHGITDGRSKPPSGANMRAQWKIVRGDLLAEGKLEPKPSGSEIAGAASRQRDVAPSSQRDDFLASLQERKLKAGRPL